MKQIHERSLIYKTDIDLNSANNPKSTMINYIKNETIVFDVGCACGDLGVVLKEHKNATMFGLEYNQGSIDVALETGAYEEIHQFDLNEITESDFQQYKGKFDYVVCGDVLEHLRNPMHSLNILKSYLKEDGKIIASIPNVAHMSIKSNLLVNDFTYTPAGLLDETHIHLFTHKSIASELTSINLRIEECKFTHQEKCGRQPNNPYNDLSDDIKEFLFRDWHSYVCQYVMSISSSSSSSSAQSSEELLKHNIKKLNIDENNAPDYIKNYRKQILAELTNTTGQKISIIEKLIETVKNDQQNIQHQISIMPQYHIDIIENTKIQFDEIKTLVSNIENKTDIFSNNIYNNLFNLRNQISSIETSLNCRNEFELKEKKLLKKIKKLKNRRKFYKNLLFIILLFFTGVVSYLIYYKM